MRFVPCACDLDVELRGSRSARAEALGDRRPASTVIVAGLANPAWKLEIEAIACT
jgi:2-iminobutanoate/2-iminopropanoate deaminase